MAETRTIRKRAAEELKKHFIRQAEPFEEGRVGVFEQTIHCRRAQAACLAITALGIYEAELNGEKIGDEYFAPGYTYYPRQLQYNIFNLRLKEGRNTLRIYLAQGWYCGRFTYENKSQIYGEYPAAAWILETEDALYSSSDEEVRLLESPYDYAGFYDGEIYHGRSDALKVLKEKPVRFEGPLPSSFVERKCAVRLREEMQIVRVEERGDKTILDFGQNFAGIIIIDPEKMKGPSLKIRHGEILNDDGSLYTSNLRQAKAELIYYKEGETKLYRPQFTYMGFRYAELSGVPYEEGLIRAFALYSDMERTGFFSTSHEKLQRLYLNQLWGQKSNYVEIPTDCPQRDERMGYTGDGHVFARSGAYNFDTGLFWRKFLRDIRESQKDNEEGYVAPTIPAQGPEGIGFLNMLGWGNAVTLIPEMLYQQYGDFSFLRDQYESIRDFVDCECRHLGRKDLWLGPNLGDWLMPGHGMTYMAMHNGPVSNSFIVHDLDTAAALAEKLSYTEDARRWKEQAEKTRKAYIKKFLRKDGRMKDDYQGAYIMALKYVIPQGELYQKVYAKWKERIIKDGMATGFFSTQHILPLLAENGDSELACTLLLQENYPGWMYQVNRGATTIWERWDAIREDGSVNETKSGGDNMVSFNHYAFGSFAEYLYGYILGIKPLEPGYKRIAIKPYPDPRLGEVEGSYHSREGLIKVAWHYDATHFYLKFETPAETLLTLPDGQSRRCEAGTYDYQIRRT